MNQSEGLMGQLLLKGWAMVADACEDCQMPFMKDKKIARFLCVACQAELATKICQGAQIKVSKTPNQFLIISKNGKERRNVEVIDGELRLGGEVTEVAKAPVEEPTKVETAPPVQ